MSITITAQALGVREFIPALSHTEDTLEDKRRQAVEPNGRHMCCESLLLAISLIFLVLGLLPFDKKRARDVHLSDLFPLWTEAAEES